MGILGAPPASHLGEAGVDLRWRTLRGCLFFICRGIVASILVFLCFGVTQAKDGPFSRPHPGNLPFRVVCVPRAGSVLSGCSVVLLGVSVLPSPSGPCLASHPGCYRLRTRGVFLFLQPLEPLQTLSGSAPHPARSCPRPPVSAVFLRGFFQQMRFPQDCPVGVGWASAGGCALGARRLLCH